VDETCPYVSRGGLKLAAALDEWAIEVAGLVCADLGASVGGFSDVLLRRDAARVYAVDTAYGLLAWSIRQNPRAALLERTNAVHFDPASIAGFAGCDLVVIDLGWTRQALAVPAARRWLGRRDHSPGRIITLVKPHYEAGPELAVRKHKGVLAPEQSALIAERVREELGRLPGVTVRGWMVSPIRGGGRRGHGTREGNIEYLALLEVSRQPGA
jgi:23S rRNA (cytidine1920-2'-O)/16S rRNA (cytidine1409-2'-O)-methyltransferase